MVEEAQKDLPSLSGLSLLVVDDDASVIRGMTRVLRGLGADVTGVASVREARVSSTFSSRTEQGSNCSRTIWAANPAAPST